MNIYELGKELNKMYTEAITKEKTLMIRLFGIKYFSEINEVKSKGESLAEIIKISGLKESYQAEINKGIKLAKYVKLK
ncbi:MAG: hypothetical protein WBG30_06720 [Psychrilyobacter sp.]|uniref:HTH-like domain-containing protein n=1 Tax=Psychrilyobacter sp. TaxID=2586924 RepID=UPI003C7359C7